MGWLRLIPDDRFVIPRIVACRRPVRPHAGRHLFPWHRPGTWLGADHKAVRRRRLRPRGVAEAAGGLPMSGGFTPF